MLGIGTSHACRSILRPKCGEDRHFRNSVDSFPCRPYKVVSQVVSKESADRPAPWRPSCRSPGTSRARSRRAPCRRAARASQRLDAPRRHGAQKPVR